MLTGLAGTRHRNLWYDYWPQSSCIELTLTQRMRPSSNPLIHQYFTHTVLAAGSVVGFIIYTGVDTHAMMDTSHPQMKIGLLDLAINRLAKVRRSMRP